jgi:hypothetical protein
MTVENDGLPPAEGDDQEPVGDGTLDPSTESLPLDAPTATKLAAADAAARQAQLNDQAAPSATQGTMEGDLFDGTEPTGREVP